MKLIVAVVLFVIVQYATYTVAAPVQAYSAFSLTDIAGVNVHLNYPGTSYMTNWTAVRTLLVNSGIKHIRDGHTAQTWVSRIKELNTYGVKLQMLAGPNNGIYPKKADCGTKTQYVCQDVVSLATTLGDAVEVVEGPNENDHRPINYGGATGWPAATRTFQIAMWNALKASPVTKNIPVGSPSNANPKTAVALAPLYDYHDLQIMHSYAGGKSPYNAILNTFWIPQSDKMSGVAGKNKRRQASECGYHTFPLHTNSDQPGVSEAVQAKYIPRTYFLYLINGIQRAMTYEFIDQKKDTTGSAQMFYGIIRYDYTPKPAYYAIKNLLSLLKDTPMSNPGKLDYTWTGPSTIKSVLLQKSNGVFYIAIWNEASAWDTDKKTATPVASVATTVTVNANVASFNVYHPNAGTNTITPTSKTTNTVTLSLPDEVILIAVTLGAAPTTTTKAPTTTTTKAPTTTTTTTTTKAPTKINCAQYKSTINWVVSAFPKAADITAPITGRGMNSVQWLTAQNAIVDGNYVSTLTKTGCPAACGTKPYAAGAWDSKPRGGYGRYSFNLRVGAMSGGWVLAQLIQLPQTPHDAIVFQFFGNNKNQVKLYYYANNVYKDVTIVKLGFDYTAAFHAYDVAYSATQMIFYIDGKQVASVTKSGTVPFPTSTTFSMSMWQLCATDKASIYGNIAYTNPVPVYTKSISFTSSANLPAAPAQCVIGNPIYGQAGASSPLVSESYNVTDSGDFASQEDVNITSSDTYTSLELSSETTSDSTTSDSTTDSSAAPMEPTEAPLTSSEAAAVEFSYETDQTDFSDTLENASENADSSKAESHSEEMMATTTTGSVVKPVSTTGSVTTSAVADLVAAGATVVANVVAVVCVVLAVIMM